MCRTRNRRPVCGTFPKPNASNMRSAVLVIDVRIIPGSYQLKGIENLTICCLPDTPVKNVADMPEPCPLIPRMMPTLQSLVAPQLSEQWRQSWHHYNYQFYYDILQKDILKISTRRPMISKRPCRSYHCVLCHRRRASRCAPASTAINRYTIPDPRACQHDDISLRTDESRKPLKKPERSRTWVDYYGPTWLKILKDEKTKNLSWFSRWVIILWYLHQGHNRKLLFQSQVRKGRNFSKKSYECILHWHFSTLKT